MKKFRQILCCVLAATFCLCMSGCFYQRLLSFKKQLKEFDKYFILEEDESVSMIFKKPVMLAKDGPRFLGAPPSIVLGEAPNAIHEYRMIKQYAPDQNEADNFDFVVQVVMKKNKIERFVFDKRYFAVMPKPMFVRTCKMFGHAKLNLAKQSLTMGEVDSEPFLKESVFLNADEIKLALGEPFEIVGNTYVYRYRLQQEGEESTWPPIVTTVTFTRQGEFMRGESSIMGGMTVERPLKMPTSPIPGHDTAVHPENFTTLRWTGGHSAKFHRVYGGEDKENLSLIGEVSDVHEIKLPDRDRTAPYYWRVDAVESDGTVHPGELYRFFPGSLVGHWTFDEEKGRTAHDATEAGNHGTLQGDAVFKPNAGIRDGALYLDKKGDGVDVSSFSMYAHTLTMTAWIKGPPVSYWAAPFHFHQSLWGGGLYVCSNNHLHYDWNLDSHEIANVHGPTLPTGEWTFIAAALDYDWVDLYLYTPSGGLKVRSHKVIHQPQRAGHLRFTWDDPQDDRGQDCLMDDFRIYNYALTRDQIEGIISEQEVPTEP
ncbi:LamG domain-containing protein [Planctomycetota bacterium]